ncbi:MAG TPA: vWA domain-containing protein [Gammaproteobacteria bacterium]|nr:vWA domain-containing protein [Gammaproteobacteria bacterium]
MQAKSLTLALLAATVAAVAVYPAFRGRAEDDAAAFVPPAPGQNRPKVEVAFVLDTTGSMGGLIGTAKEKIWSIATTMAQATPAPEIRIGLVGYRDRGDSYVTKLVDLDEDIDSVYAALVDFAADGGGDGPESVNQALDDAVTRLSWSRDPSSYKVIFLVGDAPPHMDYPGDRKYPEVVAAARAKGIVVNTIQCGAVAETVAPWQRIASLGQGRYFRVEQAGSGVAIDTPFDPEIAKLSAALDATRLYYGSAEDQAAMKRKVEATHKLSVSASPAALARRGVFNSTASGAENLAGEHDLVADAAAGTAEVAAVPEAELPPSLRSLTPEQREAVVAQKAAERERLQQQIASLAKQRDDYIEQKLEARGGAKESLDQKLYETVRAQAAEKGLHYESGPKF